MAKENLFSGLNNPDVYTLLARPFHTAFGFTEGLAQLEGMDYGAELRAAGASTSAARAV